MNEFIKMIKAELKHAEKKHPYFADIPGWGAQQHDIEELLPARRDYLKLQIEQGHVTGFCVLMCEMWEAEEAIHKGDYDHALKELAQCGAVILRNMKMVREMKKGGKCEYKSNTVRRTCFRCGGKGKRTVQAGFAGYREVKCCFCKGTGLREVKMGGGK